MSISVEQAVENERVLMLEVMMNLQLVASRHSGVMDLCGTHDGVDVLNNLVHCFAVHASKRLFVGLVSVIDYLVVGCEQFAFERGGIGCSCRARLEMINSFTNLVSIGTGDEGIADGRICDSITIAS